VTYASLRRRGLVPLALLAAGGLALPLLRYEGILVPVRITGGSMAERLRGAHREVTCAECQSVFRCDVESEAPAGRAVCPNCGYPDNDQNSGRLQPGQRVLIDRWAYWRRQPNRWELVAFQTPTDPAQLSVKRIVGLPHESVAIRGGELLIDGEIHRKSLAEAEETAVLVHDDSFRPGNLPHRWQGDRETSGWRATPQGYACRPSATGADQVVDWLTYRHWRCFASPFDRTDEAPVADRDSYNPGLSRSLHEVTDLFLTCRVTRGAGASLALLIHDGRESFQVRWGSGQVRLSRGEQLVQTADWPFATVPPHEPWPITFGIIDRQVFLSARGQEILRYPYAESDRPRQPSSRPLGIGARGGTVEISRLRVYRDIYYLNSWPRDELPLAGDEFLVLGDNTPVSQDSRHWPRPGLHRDWLLGRVLAPAHR